MGDQPRTSNSGGSESMRGSPGIAVHLSRSHPGAELVRIPSPNNALPHPHTLPYEVAEVLSPFWSPSAPPPWELLETVDILPMIFQDMWPALADGIRKSKSLGELMHTLERHPGFERWISSRVIRGPLQDRAGGAPHYAPPLSDVYRARFFDRSGLVVETTAELDDYLHTQPAPSVRLPTEAPLPADTLYVTFSEGQAAFPTQEENWGVVYIDGAYVLTDGGSSSQSVCIALTSRAPDGSTNSCAEDWPLDVRVDAEGAIQIVINSFWQRLTVGERAVAHLMPALLHVFKVLEYLGAEGASLTYRLERSDTERRLIAQGSRDRVERIRFLNQKYDRILLVPRKTG